MQAEDHHQQSWRIEVRAKAKNFNFKLKASKIQPNWKIHRLSLLLKLRTFFLKLNSQSSDSVPLQTRRTRIGTIIRSTWNKIQPIKVKKSPTRRLTPDSKLALNRIQRYAKEEPISLGILVLIIIGFVFQKGVVMFISSLVFLVRIGLGMKKFEARELWLLAVVASALACSGVVVDFRNYVKFAEAYSKFVWTPWKIVESLI